MEVTNLQIIKGINNAIEYIENNLDSTIAIDEIARLHLHHVTIFRECFIH